jgi:hypothetical protein
MHFDSPYGSQWLVDALHKQLLCKRLGRQLDRGEAIAPDVLELPMRAETTFIGVDGETACEILAILGMRN